MLWNAAAADAVVAGLAADNLVVALYFAFLFYKAQAGPDTSAEAAAAVVKKPASSSTNSSTNSNPNDSNRSSSSSSSSSSSTSSSTNSGGALLSKDSLAYSLTLACALTAAGTALAEGLLKGRISAIPITTLLTVAGASLRPQVYIRIVYSVYHVSSSGAMLMSISLQQLLLCAVAVTYLCRQCSRLHVGAYCRSALSVGNLLLLL
jgi:hypothetical protein